MTREDTGDPPNGPDRLPPLVAEFRPRGHTPRWKSALQRLLDHTIVGHVVHPGCERIEGRVANIETRPVNPLWRTAHAQARRDGEPEGRLPVDPRLSKAIHVIWTEEFTDGPIGYAVPAVLHATQVGDVVRLRVRPDDGRITGLRNLDRPRRWL